MIRDRMTQAKAMLAVAGCHDIEAHDNHQAPGLDIHEMGGARMGLDPKNSMLNKWNQLHAVPNVFVTDGACMTSTGNQSPSILYMTLTARAVDHAAQEMARQNL
jgi:choline dehydrogenase-like flavoprotein